MGDVAVWNGERRGVGWPTSRVHVPRAEGDEPLPYDTLGYCGTTR